MGSKCYQRTTGMRNKQPIWLPIIANGVALLRSGDRYIIRRDGWRTTTPLGKNEILENQRVNLCNTTNQERSKASLSSPWARFLRLLRGKAGS